MEDTSGQGMRGESPDGQASGGAGTVQSLEIVNVKGLHARAAAKFVETVERFDADVTVRRDGMEASGDSIMGLLMLAASQGTIIEIETRGGAAEGLAEALAALVAARFGEDM